MGWEKFRSIINQITKLNKSLKCPSDIYDAVLNLTETIQKLEKKLNSTIQPEKK